MPRFVVLLHETPSDYVRPTHYDVMLEDGESLLTFAIPLPPEADHAQLVERIANHRIEYLALEGEIPGGRGTVKRVDQGTFEWIDRAEKQWRVRVVGRSLQGVFRFDRLESDAGEVRIGEPKSEVSTNGVHRDDAPGGRTVERWMMWFLPDAC